MQVRRILGGLTLLLASAAALHAQDRPKPEVPKPDRQNPDSDFMERANRLNLTEIAMGKLAGTQAESIELKHFGLKMITDHQAANNELIGLANRKGLKLPGELTKDEQKMIDDMGKGSGKEFDKKFTTHMVTDHEKAVELFTRAAGSAQDADVKTFAARMLPKLEEHLREAKTLRDKVQGRQDKPEKPEKPEKPDKPGDKPEPPKPDKPGRP
jgi:putative membrane protein